MMRLIRVIYDELINPDIHKRNLKISSPLLGIRGRIANAIVNRKLASSKARRALFKSKTNESARPPNKYEMNRYIVWFLIITICVLVILSVSR